MIQEHELREKRGHRHLFEELGHKHCVGVCISL